MDALTSSCTVLLEGRMGAVLFSAVIEVFSAKLGGQSLAVAEVTTADHP